MKLRYTTEARDAIRHRHRWWIANREKAPTLFAEELKATVDKLRANMDAARQRYSGEGAETVWRVLMPRTRHHVYYWRDEAADIATVLLVANAIAETGPDL